MLAGSNPEYREYFINLRCITIQSDNLDVKVNFVTVFYSHKLVRPESLNYRNIEY